MIITKFLGVTETKPARIKGIFITGPEKVEHVVSVDRLSEDSGNTGRIEDVHKECAKQTIRKAVEELGITWMSDRPIMSRNLPGDVDQFAHIAVFNCDLWKA